MSIRDAKGGVENKIPVKTVLVSAFNKDGLETFIPGLVEICQGVRFLSTGGTYRKLAEILGDEAVATGQLGKVEDYTQFPEMEGGLVKTLHPKIHAGLLGERNNPEHQRYLKEDLGEASFIDMVVVNLYPFDQVIAQPDVTFEQARGNIDIGGPTMLSGAAKNFLGCAAVSHPSEYEDLLWNIRENKGCTTLRDRFELAQITIHRLAKYRDSNAGYFINQDPVQVEEFYLGGD